MKRQFAMQKHFCFGAAGQANRDARERKGFGE